MILSAWVAQWAQGMNQGEFEMSAEKREETKDLFEELGLEVTTGKVEVGNTYPIFGMITQFMNEEPGAVVAEINHNITARMNVQDQERVNVLKQKAFEAGIFISRVIAVEPKVEVECHKVIFGKSQSYNA